MISVTEILRNLLPVEVVPWVEHPTQADQQAVVFVYSPMSRLVLR